MHWSISFRVKKIQKIISTRIIELVFSGFEIKKIHNWNIWRSLKWREILGLLRPFHKVSIPNGTYPKMLGWGTIRKSSYHHPSILIYVCITGHPLSQLLGRGGIVVLPFSQKNQDDLIPWDLKPCFLKYETSWYWWCFLERLFQVLVLIGIIVGNQYFARSLRNQAFQEVNL